MRRFSQRNSLVTLSDINITPLLDLAFVLLIIFVITTPLLEQGMKLNLPAGGQPDQKLNRKDILTVEVDPRGNYMLDRRVLPLDRIEVELVRAHRANPNLVIHIRIDKAARMEFFADLLSRCERNSITRFQIRTQADR